MMATCSFCDKESEVVVRYEKSGAVKHCKECLEYAACGMCGKEKNKTSYRWYQYDNGQMFRESVCINCADLHNLLTEGK